MVKIILLGATGNLGGQVRNILANNHDKFKLVAISGYNETDIINGFINDFSSIEDVNIIDEKVVNKINFNNVFVGSKGIVSILEKHKDCLVVNCIAGIAGLEPTLSAIRLDMDVALANKECIVCAGDFIKQEMRQHKNVSIFPIDSEHSAIYQCLVGEDINSVNKLIITCSGGPFYKKTKEDLKDVSIKEVIAHPKWNMGNIMNVYSATLFNKGLEVIEAHYLYGLDYEHIETLIHRESVIHSLVEFKDGNVKALLGPTSMELPLLYAINKTNRDVYLNKYLDFKTLKSLSFDQIDNATFPAVNLAYKVGRIGGNKPMVYCVANEIATKALLNNTIKFLDVYDVVNFMVNNYETKYDYSLEELYQMIDEVSVKTQEYIKAMKGE